MVDAAFDNCRKHKYNKVEVEKMSMPLIEQKEITNKPEKNRWARAADRLRLVVDLFGSGLAVIWGDLGPGELCVPEKKKRDEGQGKTPGF